MQTPKQLLQFIPENNALNNKVIIITGASSGLGKQAAITYARYGATVVLLDKVVKQLEQSYDEIIDKGFPQPAIYPIDFLGAQDPDYEKLAETIASSLGSIDGLLLNAAWLPSFTPIKHYDTETWVKAITVNLHAPFLLARSCLPYLEQSQNDPSIIFSSHYSDKAFNGAFGVAKAGCDSLMKIMADEYDDKPFIRINGIDTGPIQTSMRVRAYPAENPEINPTPEALMGPYLYYMSHSAKKETGNLIRYKRSDIVR